MDKISVIIPVYRVEAYLPRCVDSMLGQTYQNLEIILVDDGSPDNSGAIIDRYSRQEPRVIALHQPENMGVSAARNRGLDAATGDWIAFCDGDDWYVPEAMEKLLHCAKAQQADYVVCNYQLVSDGAPAIPVDTVAPIRENASNRQVIACGSVSSCCHLFHRTLFAASNARYPVGIGHNEELPVVPVLAKYASKIAVLDEPLYCYYQRGGGSASNTTTDLEPELLAALSAMKQLLGPGYEAEADYHGIYTLLYGEILRLCKQGAASALIRRRISDYETHYPDYVRNPYYSGLGKAKQIFLWLERKRCIVGLRLLAKIHSILVH